MTIQELRDFEPLFGFWKVDGKISQGKSSQVYRVSKSVAGTTEYKAIKVTRYPKDETEYQRAVSQGNYQKSDEYLLSLEEKVKEYLQKMISLKGNKNIVEYYDYMIVHSNHCFYAISLFEFLMPLNVYYSKHNYTSMDIAKLGFDISTALCTYKNAFITCKKIKTENIFVTRQGVYKIGDFGFEFENEEFDENKFYEYCPPELCNENGNFQNGDLYSLGMILYKYCILKEDTNQSLPQKRLSSGILPTPKFADETLAKIILKATQFYPQKRYSSVEFLTNDLSLYLSGMTVNKTKKSDVPNVYEAKSNASKEEFQKVFADNDETDTNENKKKIYITVGAVILAVIIFAVSGIFLSQKTNDDAITTSTTRAIITKATEKETQNTTEQEETTTQSETTTEEETITQNETTTKEETKDETTEVLESESTSYTPSVSEEKETDSDYSVLSKEVILYSQSDKESGETDSAGRKYKNISPLSVKSNIQNDSIMKVVVSIKAFGNYPSQNASAYICQLTDSTLILKEAVDFNCSFDEDEPLDNVDIIIDLLGDIYYDDSSDFYIVFEEGAIASDESISLPIQIKIE